MPLKLAIAPYQLMFKHPFGTAHGVRYGTDSVFVRLERNGHYGYGEATTPPYVAEQQADIIEKLQQVELQDIEEGIFRHDLDPFPATRAALNTAYYDLISKEKDTSVLKLLQAGIATLGRGLALMTLGLSDPTEILSKLDEMEPFNGLKVKLNGVSDKDVLMKVLKHDDRPMLLDANQAWTSVEHALQAIDLVGAERLIGLEQPFPVDRTDLQRELIQRTNVTVYGDESIRDLNDLEAAAGMFSGVNLKLMKCGGIDIAATMASRACELGLKVMLGSMSESSLGCGAMLHLAGLADVVDLDGPWLINNDPFQGIELRHGDLHLVNCTGMGIQERQPSLLNWTYVGA